MSLDHPGQAAARPPGGGGDARWAARSRGRSTCASCPPPARTCRRRSRAARSARTSTTASTSSPSPSRRCARAARTSRSWPSTSCAWPASRTTCKPKRLSPRAVDLLIQLPWQGNVRELRNLMERLVVLVRQGRRGRSRSSWTSSRCPAMRARGRRARCRCAQARARFERQYILYRLTANRGNLGDTARELGIERTNLYRKMKQLGIQAPHARPAVSVAHSIISC